MTDVDVKDMTKEQLINIVKDLGKKIDKLETTIQSATDFIDGVKAGKKNSSGDEEDWF